MTKSQNILRFYGDTDFITGLRAIAATMVVIIHTGAFLDFGAVGQTITEAGKYGVHIFFVISGFTIAKTFTEARDYKSYLIRRLMRIIPLYWLMVSIATALLATGCFSMPHWMTEFGSQLDLYNFLMHLSMLSYLDYRVANSLIGVEWTIPIEVFWYISLPFLIKFGKTVPKTIGTMLALLFLTAILTYFSKELFDTRKPISWSPIAYGHLFFLGVLSYHLRERFTSTMPKFTMIPIMGAVAIFSMVLIFNLGLRSTVFPLCTAVFIIYVTPARAGWLTQVLTTRPMLFLGSISYSTYLIHNLVIHVLRDLEILPVSGLGKFLFVYSITVALSTVTYLLVEKPTNQVGRRMTTAR